MNGIFNIPAFLASFPVMAKGMSGVFLVIGAIWLCIALMNRLDQ